MQSVKYFAATFRVILLYPSNFFRKPSLPVGGREVDAVIGSHAQENRERFVKRCSILGRKVVRIIRECSINKRFEVYQVLYDNVGFEYGV